VQGNGNGGSDGYASCRVAAGVTSHPAYGLGVYCYFDVDPGVVADHAIEAPDTPGVGLHDRVTVSLGGAGTISHIVNETGAAADSGSTVADLVGYP
jgi:hypothetical protein